MLLYIFLNKVKIKVVLGTIFVLALAAVSVVVQTQPVLAINYNCDTNTASDDYNRFPFGFFCPRNDGSSGDLNARYTQVTLDNGDSTPRGSYSTNRDAANGEKLAPGQTLNFTADYEREGGLRTAPPNDATSDNPPDNNTAPNDNGAYVWVIVDGNDSIIADNGVKGSISDGSWNSGTSHNAWNPDGRDTARGCPNVNAYAGNGPNDINRSPFTSAPLDGDISCQNQGKMIMWRLDRDQANSLGVPGDNTKLRFSVRLKDDLPYGNYEVCLRTIVSVRYNTGADDEYPFTASKLGHIAAKSKYRCYMVSSTRVEGTVRSSEDYATGKVLPSVTIFYDKNCNGDVDKQQTTNVNGMYAFDSNVGELYCLYARGSTGAPPPRNTEIEESNGTDYREPEGLYRGLNIVSRTGITWQVAGVGCGDNAQGSNSNSNNYYVNCYGRTQDMPASHETEAKDANGNLIISQINSQGHDFKFNPVPTPPMVIKSSWGEGTDENGNLITDPVLSQTLRPGDWVNFDVYIENGIDANQNVSFTDYIPLNIDPNTAVIECIQIDPLLHQYQPANWEVLDAYVDCRSEEDGTLVQGAYNSYIYLDTVLNNLQSGRYIYYKNMGSGSTRPQLTFTSERMPAYSGIAFSWRGRVKDRNHIGVYPGGPAGTSGYTDHRFCANPNGSTYNSSNQLITECEDTTAGYQGVTNFAEAFASGNMTPYQSPVTFNPIPGNIRSISKSISSVTTFGGIPAYSLDPPYLNTGIFRSTIDPDDTMGPVRYQVIDQSNGANNFAGSPLDIAISDVGTPNPGASLSNPTANSLGVLTWRDTGNADQMINSAHSGYRDFTFNAQFDDDRPVGGIATNVSKICWPKYWEAGHGIDCRFSNQAQIRRIRIDKPTVAAEYGGVHGGGNIRITGGGDQTCSEIEGALGILRANTGSYGLYMLSSKNTSNVNDFWSKSGFNVTGTTSGQGLKCRPDLAREAQNFATSGAAPSSISGTTPDDYKNKVMKTTGNVTIGDGGAVTTVNGRWTLFVEGRVYIRGNIVRSGTNALANSSSLGIIATDGIYIDKNVNRVEALLYAGGMSYSAGDTPTGNLYNGVIDTCARSESESLSTNFYNPANCREQNLTVSGIMNARNLKLNRTKVSVTDNADKVVLPGHTYILAPPAFNLLFNQGSNYGYIREERPRF